MSGRPVMELPLAWLMGHNRSPDFTGRPAQKVVAPALRLLAWIADHPGTLGYHAELAGVVPRGNSHHAAAVLLASDYITRTPLPRGRGVAFHVTPAGRTHLDSTHAPIPAPTTPEEPSTDDRA